MVLADFGFPDLDPAAPVGSLSVARQQIVEIAKALVTEPRILILDEPTAVLSASETAKLFARVKSLAAAGGTVLYISHRLEEIFEIADEIVVLKDGASVLAAPVAELDHDRIIRAMVGRPLSAVFPGRVGEPGRVVLEVERLGLRGSFEDVSFAVRAGEIVGMFGLVGSGRTEVAKAIFGARPADAGSVRLDGRDVRFATPAEAVRSGLAMLTEDRKGDGLVLEPERARQCRARELPALLPPRRHRRPRGARRWSARRSTSSRSGRATPAGRCGSSPAATSRRWCIAKWLLVEGTRLFIFDEPTRGVDVATRVEIYRMIRDLATAGAAVLLISSEMPEVLGLADRLLVMRAGRLVAELPPDAEAEEVFALAAGLPFGDRPDVVVH